MATMDIVELLLNVALLGSAWILWLLLALSVISVGVVLERAIFFYKNAKRGGDALARGLFERLRAGDEEGAKVLLRDSGTVEGLVVARAFTFREGGAPGFGDALDAELSRAKKDLEKGMTFLGTVGNNAPFIGLLGTVIGVIQAFEVLGTASARASAMGSVMAGIAEALVATGVGIFVAIPAVIAYNIGQQRIAEIERAAFSLGHIVSGWLEVRERGGILRPAIHRHQGEAVGGLVVDNAEPPASDRAAIAATGKD